MRENTHYLASINDKKATIRLFGELGDDINGNWLGQDIYWAGEEVGEIDLLINSAGGNVIEGFSVISAIQNTGAKVHAKIMGVAASMAGVIAMACDEISMVDFGRIMIHDPHLGGKKASPKQQKALDNLRGMLASIYMNRTGLSESEVAKIMKDETWLTAEDALEQGFIDSILKTKKEAMVSPEASTQEIMAVATQLYQSKNPDSMSKVIQMAAIMAAVSLEGIGDESTEEQILNALKAKDSTITDLQAKLDKAPKQEELDQLKASLEAARKEKATIKVEALIREGRLDEKKKETLIEAALKDEASFDALLDAVPVTAPRASAHIQGEGESNSRKDWTYDDYQKKDPEALAEMQKEKPEEFEALFEAHFSELNN